MSLRGTSPAPATFNSAPPSGFNAVTNIFTKDVTYAPGLLAALLSTVTTTTVAGLLTTDQVLVQCVGTMTSGAIIANARVSASNTLEVTFSTAVALGITLGSLTFRVTVFR